jgi:hypothetical protein
MTERRQQRDESVDTRLVVHPVDADHVGGDAPGDAPERLDEVGADDTVGMPAATQILDGVQHHRFDRLSLVGGEALPAEQPALQSPSQRVPRTVDGGQRVVHERFDVGP